MTVERGQLRILNWRLSQKIHDPRVDIVKLLIAWTLMGHRENNWGQTTINYGKGSNPMKSARPHANTKGVEEMKLIILRLVLVLAAFTVVPNALAAGSDSGNLFFDAKFGKTFGGPGSAHSGYFSDAQSSWGADGGYRWKLDDSRSLGFEVGYLHFGDVAPDNPDPMSFTTAEVSASAITAGGHYQFLFGDDKASIFQARLGLMRVKFDESYSIADPGVPVTTGSYSWRQGGTYFGLGVGRQITQSFSLILAYNRYNSGDTRQAGGQIGLDLDWLGLEAEYRF